MTLLLRVSSQSSQAIRCHITATVHIVLLNKWTVTELSSSGENWRLLSIIWEG